MILSTTHFSCYAFLCSYKLRVWLFNALRLICIQVHIHTLPWLHFLRNGDVPHGVNEYNRIIIHLLLLFFF